MPIKHLKVNRYSKNYTKKILNGGSPPPKQPKVSGGIKPRHDPSRAGFRTHRPVVQSGVSGVSGVSPPPKQPKGISRHDPSRAGFKRTTLGVRSGVSGVSGVSGGIQHPHNSKLTGNQSIVGVKPNTVNSPVNKPKLRPNNQQTEQKIMALLRTRRSTA